MITHVHVHAHLTVLPAVRPAERTETPVRTGDTAKGMAKEVGLCAGVAIAEARKTLLDGAAPAGPPRPAAPARAGRASSMVARFRVGAQAESVKRARDFAAATLRSWNRGDLGDSVQLVVSELVTNALRHGLAGRVEDALSLGHVDTRVELILACEPRYLTCAVTDPSDDIPVVAAPADLTECGRGLHVVAACSRRWGWTRFATGGKAVWAAFHYAP